MHAMHAMKNAGPTLVVRQVRSGIGYNETQKATLRALGLGRVGKRRCLTDNEQVRGMVASVVHLVVIEDPALDGGRAVERAGRSRRTRRRHD
jgi:large subunit ribosomal protein L30